MPDTSSAKVFKSIAWVGACLALPFVIIAQGVPAARRWVDVHVTHDGSPGLTGQALQSLQAREQAVSQSLADEREAVKGELSDRLPLSADDYKVGTLPDTKRMALIADAAWLSERAEKRTDWLGKQTGTKGCLAEGTVMQSLAETVDNQSLKEAPVSKRSALHENQTAFHRLSHSQDAQLHRLDCIGNEVQFPGQVAWLTPFNRPGGRTLSRDVKLEETAAVQIVADDRVYQKAVRQLGIGLRRDPYTNAKPVIPAL